MTISFTALCINSMSETTRLELHGNIAVYVSSAPRNSF